MMDGMTISATPDPNLIATIETLNRSECLNYLATSTIARVGLLVDGRPEVLPVNYALDGETILFRTAKDTVLHQASLSIVAIEVDRIDEVQHTGWSVLIQGVARDLGDAIDPTSERIKRLTLITWAPGGRDRWFRVDPDKMTGRRIRAIPAAL